MEKIKQPEKRVRIAYFIDRLIQGGTELQLIEQINRLHDRGIDQELFCLYKTKEHDRLIIKCRDNILGIRKLISFYTFLKLIKLIFYLRKKKFTIIQTYFFDSTMVGVLSGKIAGASKIISCRRDLGFWYTPFLLFCLRSVNMLTDGFIVNSSAAKKNMSTLESVDVNDIFVLPNGIDIAQFRYSVVQRESNRKNLHLMEDDFCVGLIANMTREVKRVDLFIKMAEYALHQSDKMKFLILGDGDLKERLISMTKAMGITEKVLFLGRDVSKHRVLSAIDIGVLTSDSESLSNSIMEYMAAGLPVVATDAGGNSDLVKNGKTGFIVPLGDFKALGDRIIQLRENKALRLKLGSHGRENIAQYDWTEQLDKLIQYYEGMVRK